MQKSIYKKEVKTISTRLQFIYGQEDYRSKNILAINIARKLRKEEREKKDKLKTENKQRIEREEKIATKRNEIARAKRRKNKIKRKSRRK